MLMHGDMDDNVHPANTIQLIDELEKANRTFDLVWAPNRNHGLNEPYFIRRRWDYFVQYLMGVMPPDNYLIVPPPDFRPNRRVGLTRTIRIRMGGRTGSLSILPN